MHHLNIFTYNLVHIYKAFYCSSSTPVDMFVICEILRFQSVDFEN
jgi:hypothetical protein